MDKLIQDGKGEVTITNDGATILKQMNVIHPAAKMLVELSKAQDIKAGDGTTSVVVLAGSLLEAAEKLMAKGLHPSAIADGFRAAARKATEILRNELAIPLNIDDKSVVIKCAATSLNSTVVSQQSSLLASILYCFRAFAEALEVIPLTLAENSGMSAINAVTELRKLPAEGQKSAGLNVKKGAIANIMDDNVVQPLLVTLSVINLATETVASILKIDDIVNSVR